MSSSYEERVRRTWKFLTNHAHTLICIAQDPGVRIQDIADRVGITLRAAQSIVGDLVDAGYVTRTRVGRRNRYEVHTNLPFRHPIAQDHRVGELLSVLARTKDERRRARVSPSASG